MRRKKAESPTDLTKRSWRYVARKTVREYLSDECTDLAAGLTYYAVLGVFPTAIALASLLGLAGQRGEAVDTVLGILEDVGAGSVADTIRPTLEQLTNTPGAGLALVLGLAAALWTASAYVGAFGRAMNRIYEVREGRPIWKLRPLMLLLTLVLVTLAAAVVLALLLSGPVAEAVGSALGVSDVAVLAWQIVKWPVLLGLVIAIVALLYYATPNVKQPSFRWISPGAVVAILTWLVLSAGFAFYVANFSSYSRTYGALAGVIVFLLWLWLTNLALLFGAELDAELERGRELQAGIPAEHDIRLPLRDTSKIDKDEQRDREEFEQGRALRRQANGHAPDSR